MKKYILIAILALALTIPMIACGGGNDTPAESKAESATTGGETGGLIIETDPETATPAESETSNETTAAPSESDSANETSESDSTAETAAPSESGVPDTSVTPDTSTPEPISQTITLTFNGNRISAADAAGNAVSSSTFMKVDGNALIIYKPGSYELKGDLSNGQIRIEVDKTADVELILNNFTASNSTSAPLYIKSANQTDIILADGSVNTLTDATLYQFPVGEDKPNACLYSSDDLTIKGGGTLHVNGRYNNGIGCKNDLRIKSGTINVTAINNILKGNDSVEIETATVTLRGGEDAIKADNELKEGKGYILITAGAKVDIQCLDDALQAATSITVEAGASITGQAGGDATNCPGSITIDETAMKLEAATQP